MTLGLGTVPRRPQQPAPRRRSPPHLTTHTTPTSPPTPPHSTPFFRYDANISLPGCDKNMPGTIIAAARLNRPALMVYGGTIRAGRSMGGEPLDIVSAFQSYGTELKGGDRVWHGL